MILGATSKKTLFTENGNERYLIEKTRVIGIIMSEFKKGKL